MLRISKPATDSTDDSQQQHQAATEEEAVAENYNDVREGTYEEVEEEGENGDVNVKSPSGKRKYAPLAKSDLCANSSVGTCSDEFVDTDKSNESPKKKKQQQQQQQRQLHLKAKGHTSNHKKDKVDLKAGDWIRVQDKVFKNIAHTVQITKIDINPSEHSHVLEYGRNGTLEMWDHVCLVIVDTATGKPTDSSLHHGLLSDFNLIEGEFS